LTQGYQFNGRVLTVLYSINYEGFDMPKDIAFSKTDVFKIDFQQRRNFIISLRSNEFIFHGIYLTVQPNRVLSKTESDSAKA